MQLGLPQVETQPVRNGAADRAADGIVLVPVDPAQAVRVTRTGRRTTTRSSFPSERVKDVPMPQPVPMRWSAVLRSATPDPPLRRPTRR